MSEQTPSKTQCNHPAHSLGMPSALCPRCTPLAKHIGRLDDWRREALIELRGVAYTKRGVSLAAHIDAVISGPPSTSVEKTQSANDATRVERLTALLRESLHDGDRPCECGWCEKVRPLVSPDVAGTPPHILDHLNRQDAAELEHARQSAQRVSDEYLSSTLNEISQAKALDSQMISTAFLRMLITELMQRRSFGHWQPIETAPLDTSPILMTDEKWVAAGFINSEGHFKFSIHHFAVSQEYDWKPTRWMPIPAFAALDGEVALAGEPCSTHAAEHRLRHELPCPWCVIDELKLNREVLITREQFDSELRALGERKAAEGMPVIASLLSGAEKGLVNCRFNNWPNHLKSDAFKQLGVEPVERFRRKSGAEQ
jgi:hypothetical protein